MHPSFAPHDAAPQVSREAALQALQLLLPPLLRLALRAGLKYPEIDTLLREGLLSMAPQLAAQANTSQLSVLTGLHRKAVAQWREHQQRPARARSLRKDPALRGHAAQVFTLWQRMAEDESALATLPMHAAYTAVAKGRRARLPQSFAALARQVSTDVHPRSLLDELIRLGLASEAQGEVRLQRQAFVPQRDADDRLAVMAGNAAAHLGTGVRNCTEPALQPQLEQAIWAEGLSLADALALDAQARELWAAAHRLLYAAIETAPAAPAGQTAYQVRIGMYAHAHPSPTAQELPCAPPAA